MGTGSTIAASFPAAGPCRASNFIRRPFLLIVCSGGCFLFVSRIGCGSGDCLTQFILLALQAMLGSLRGCRVRRGSGVGVGGPR